MKNINNLNNILMDVQKPGRYIGGEWNSVIKADADIYIALAYPDTYEVGMSNLALQILYETINRHSKFAAERVFAPWPDMESKLREFDIPLFTLESKRPVKECDIFGITLQHELTYTNILNMLDLAGIPLLSSQRDSSYPLVVGGGPGVLNPEPIADFFDIFVIGDAEELVLELLETQRAWKYADGNDKNELLKALAKLDSVYVPSFYPTDKQGYSSAPLNDGSYPVKKRTLTQFNSVPIPTRPVVPFIEVIHDRCMVEIMRGCTRGCRFCQAGIIYRPFRERAPNEIMAAIKDNLDSTGHNEVSLSSLSSTDYSRISSLVKDLTVELRDERVALSLPSMRTDCFSVDIASELRKIKKTGLTFAPEAGSERMRQVINKGVDEDDLMKTALTAFKQGWSRLKLYFMIGLPTETMTDVGAIAELSHKVLSMARENLSKSEYQRLSITVSVSTFVPKPHTPFQWETMISLKEIRARQNLLKEKLRHRRIKFKWHQAEVSLVEGALARGDRRLADVILSAWRLGAKFDSWDEYFSWEKWQLAFKENGLVLEEYAARKFSVTDKLPWDHIDCLIDKDWLISELEKSHDEDETMNCRNSECSQCGVCKFKGIGLEKADI